MGVDPAQEPSRPQDERCHRCPSIITYNGPRNDEVPHRRRRASVVPAEIEHTPDAPDARSYRVSFDKIKGSLSFAPRFTVIDGVREIYAALRGT